jgi:PAS domain S-box-containing protein
LNAYNDPVFLFSTLSPGLERFVYVNEAAILRYGYSLQEFQKMMLADVSVNSDMIAIIERDTPKNLSVPARSIFYTRHFGKSGATFPVEICSSIVEWNQQICYLLIVKDQSVQADLQSAVALWKEKFRTVFQASPDAITLSRVHDGVYCEVNETFSRILGYHPGEVIGKSVFELNIWKNEEDREELTVLLRTKGFAENFEAEFVAKNGTYRSGLISACIFNFKGQELIFTITRDITERKQEQEELKLMTFALDHIGDEVHLVDENGRFVYVNQQTCKTTGYSRDELLGMRGSQVIMGRPSEEDANHLHKLWDARFLAEENVQRTKDGTLYPVEVFANPFVYRGSRYALVLARNIEDRKNADKKMQLMTFAMDHISEEVHLVGSDHRFVYVNQKACEALGYSRDELLKMKIQDVAPERSATHNSEVQRNLKEHKTVTDESVHKRRDGKTYPVEVTANCFEYDGVDYNLALVRDITERRRDEEERRQFEKRMVQTQKMESLGVLAGGVAHDFNNLIGAILGQAELTKRTLPEETVAYENLGQIEIAAERAADLAGQMLAYSGRGKVVVETIALNLLIEETLSMLKVSIPKNIDFHLDSCPLLPGIDADATQIRQIIMNLIINAAEACGDSGGLVSIVSGCIDCTESFFKNTWFDREMPAGRYVSLEVADNGCGMEEETLSKLFDPFFTTKFTGRGLGMSAVLGIVRGHKGAITVESKKGEGTTFRVLFPASGEMVEVKKDSPDNHDWRGEGTVLLVDDEDMVRRICADMLKTIGFTPLTAKDGLEALEVYRDNPDIRLVLLDLTMPNLDGEQCLYAMRKIHPDVNVILSSGYSELEVSQRFVGKGVSGFLQKPYRLASLAAVLRRALAE